MKRTLIFFIVTALVSLPGNSQLWRLRRLELTASAGTTHSFTDIGRYTAGNSYWGFRNISRVNTGLAISATVRYRLTGNLAARFSITDGFLHASDINGDRVARGYEALIGFFEPSVSGEFFIVRNKREDALLFIKSRRSGIHPPMAYFDVYLFAGIGGVFRDVTPNPSLALHITDTRGFTPVIPAGIGISKIFSKSFKGGLELGGRYVLGNDLEALSAAGRGNDAYYFLSVNFNWRMKTKKYPAL